MLPENTGPPCNYKIIDWSPPAPPVVTPWSEGRIVVFKSLAISKLIQLALVTDIPTSTINFLTKIQMEFIWKWKNPKIKNSTLCNDYENGGPKNVDIFSKVVNLQYSWIKRLFDDNFHQYKLIPFYLIRQYLGKHFKFHSNLEVSQSVLCKFLQASFFTGYFTVNNTGKLYMLYQRLGRNYKRFCRKFK